jgi:hypothetical protein
MHVRLQTGDLVIHDAIEILKGRGIKLCEEFPGVIKCVCGSSSILRVFGMKIFPKLVCYTKAFVSKIFPNFFSYFDDIAFYLFFRFSSAVQLVARESNIGMSSVGIAWDNSVEPAVWDSSLCPDSPVRDPTGTLIV